MLILIFESFVFILRFLNQFRMRKASDESFARNICGDGLLALESAFYAYEFYFVQTELHSTSLTEQQTQCIFGII